MLPQVVCWLVLGCSGVAAITNYYVPPSPNSDAPNTNGAATINQFNAQRLLDVTNLVRMAHGLPPVAWNTELSSKMQAFANSCPGFVHGGPTGFQNLAGNFESCNSAASCLGDTTGAWQWYSEESLWDYSKQTCSTGQWSDCGHFTNLMSPGVTDIGCGMSYCSRQANAYHQVWCNYNGAEINPVVPPRNGSLADLKAAISNPSAYLWAQLSRATPA
ncbi:hypothetical protein ACHHYP_03670 [Achlya hypogyna]|uniref:Secreted protein n=1 Tax=Achlya hypogyna TaxID=1202772 RepID=A0A0A7CM50_ACHHY|nr:secreted protein [Achlya hypogyna]OQR92479.1 hypothetical protein ACHHYP_03670 [Achlya hypogyna]